jgi:hypothetical protein
VGGACAAFFLSAGNVRGAVIEQDLAVPAGRSVVLAPGARTLHSAGWMFTASAIPGAR